MFEIHEIPFDLSLRAAGLVIELANQSIRERGRSMIALSGGASPEETYRLLASVPFRSQVDWSVVHFFWSDERCVPPTDPESNYAQAKRLFLDRLEIPPGNIHRIRAELEPIEAAREYARVLGEFAIPPQLWPMFDVVVLGLGEDGHTASLFPGSPIDSDSPIIAVSVKNQGRLANRISMTPLVINQSHNVIFIVTGGRKARALSNVFAESGTRLDHPARRIQPKSGRLFWLVDRAAAGLLNNQEKE